MKSNSSTFLEMEMQRLRVGSGCERYNWEPLVKIPPFSATSFSAWNKQTNKLAHSLRLKLTAFSEKPLLEYHSTPNPISGKLWVSVLELSKIFVPLMTAALPTLFWDYPSQGCSLCPHFTPDKSQAGVLFISVPLPFSVVLTYAWHQSTLRSSSPQLHVTVCRSESVWCAEGVFIHRPLGNSHGFSLQRERGQVMHLRWGSVHRARW